MIHEHHPDTKFKIFSSMSLYGPSVDQFLHVYDYLKTLPNVEYSPAIDREELVKHYQNLHSSFIQIFGKKHSVFQW